MSGVVARALSRMYVPCSSNSSHENSQLYISGRLPGIGGTARQRPARVPGCPLEMGSGLLPRVHALKPKRPRWRRLTSKPLGAGFGANLM